MSASVTPGTKIGLLAQLWRRKIVFALVFAAVFGGSVVALKVIPVRYSASGSVIVAEQEAGQGNTSAAWVQKLGDPADLESQLLVIKSPRVMRLAIAVPGVLEAARAECDLGVQTAKLGAIPVLGKLLAGSAGTCTQLQPGSDTLFDWYERRVSVASVGRSRVINVSYQSQSAEVAQTMANALITAFLADQRAASAQSREATAAWLWQEVAQLDTSLRSEEAQIQAFRRQNGLVRGQLAPISSERLSSIGMQLSQAQAAQADAAARLQELGRNAGGAGDSRAAMDSRAVADLKQQLATALAQQQSAALTLGPNHPVLGALRQQVGALQSRLGSEASSIATSAQRTYAAATTQVAELKEQLEAVKGDVGSATDSEAAIANMVRSVEIKRGLYVDLYKRASDLETERRVLLGSTRLVSLAELPSLPFFPKRTPFLAAGLTLALILASLAAFARDLADRSVRAAAGIEAMTEAPVLAQLPLVRRSRIPGFGRRGPGLRVALGLAERTPLVQDSLRSLYARLVLAGFGGTRRKLLITSAEPQEGKTFTTLALGQIVAASGRRVLVIECDLRRPAFQTALGLKDGPGLVDVLRGHATVEEVVQRALPGTLDVITAGLACADSTELLMGRRLTDLLRWTDSYDLVLIDTPPSGIMMDARLLSRHADGVLVCMRAGQTQMAEAVDSVNALREAGSAVMGVIMTGVDPSQHRHYDPRPIAKSGGKSGGKTTKLVHVA